MPLKPEAHRLAKEAESLLKGMTTIRGEEGVRSQAIDKLQEAIEQDENFPWAHAHLGDLYSEIGRADAEESLKKAIELKPGYAWAHAKLGAHYARQEQFRDALLCFDAAIKANPRYAWAFAHKAHCLWHLSKTDEQLLQQALSAAKKAIEFAPGDEYDYAFAVRAGIFAQLGQLVANSNLENPEAPENLESVKAKAELYRKAVESWRYCATDLLKLLTRSSELYNSSKDHEIQKSITEAIEKSSFKNSSEGNFEDFTQTIFSLLRGDAFSNSR